MSAKKGGNSPSRLYPPEIKERAVRMVTELRLQDPRDQSVISRVARQLGVGTEALRSWVKRAEVDAGNRPGVSSTEESRIKELEREIKELRRSNEILQAADHPHIMTFFATELDGQTKK